MGNKPLSRVVKEDFDKRWGGFEAYEVNLLAIEDVRIGHIVRFYEETSSFARVAEVPIPEPELMMPFVHRAQMTYSYKQRCSVSVNNHGKMPIPH